MSIPNRHKYSKMSCRHVTFMLTIIIQQNHNFGLCTYCLPLCHNEQQKMGANVASFILGSKPGSFQCNATGLFTFPQNFRNCWPLPFILLYWAIIRWKLFLGKILIPLVKNLSTSICLQFADGYKNRTEKPSEAWGKITNYLLHLILISFRITKSSNHPAHINITCVECKKQN